MPAIEEQIEERWNWWGFWFGLKADITQVSSDHSAYCNLQTVKNASHFRGSGRRYRILNWICDQSKRLMKHGNSDINISSPFVCSLSKANSFQIIRGFRRSPVAVPTWTQSVLQKAGISTVIFWPRFMLHRGGNVDSTIIWHAALYECEAWVLFNICQCFECCDRSYWQMF